MHVPTSTRRTALMAGAALSVTATAAVVLFLVTGSTAAAGATAAASTAPASAPVITPQAAALIPGPIDIHRYTRSNVVTVRVDFQPGDATGWHSHPGPVLVQVVSGSVSLRHATHGRCVTHVVPAGHGFFEAPGAVHDAVNRSSGASVLYATFVLAPGAPAQVPAPTPAACR